MLNLKFSPFPVLQTERLVLRKIEISDAPQLFLLRSNTGVMEYLDRPMAQHINDAVDLIHKITDSLKTNDGITWAITLKNDPGLIGTIGYWRIIKDHFRAEIGYMLDLAYQRKGFMQEAMRTVLDFGFSEMKLHSVEANVNPANAASARLLERIGFTKEAYFKENYFYNNRFLDSAIYSLLTPFV